MNIGFYNFDSSFFQLQVEGLDDIKMKKDISDRIISLEITEEMGKIITGNIQIVDEDDMRYTNVLKGKKISCKWGYSNMDFSGQQEFRKQNNPNELWSPTLVNRYLNGFIKNPSGGGDENGVFTFNCSFYGREFEDKSVTKSRQFTSGTKEDVISQIMTEMGVLTQYVSFRRGKEKIDKNTSIRKEESNFRFLARYAHEWRAMFRIAYSNTAIKPLADPPEYRLVGIFCDYDDDISVKRFLSDIFGGVVGDSSTFDYKMSGSPNVISYTWQHNQGEAGSGDNVRVVTVGGNTEFYYMKADDQQVTYYKLNTARMQRELSQRGDLASQTRWLSEMFDEAAGGMENLTKGKDPYFVPCTESTAPQGMGLSANMEVIGNPMYTCPARVQFGAGFPDFFHVKKGLTFYQTRVSHKISRAGYRCSIQVADSYTTSGGSLVG